MASKHRFRPSPEKTAWVTISHRPKHAIRFDHSHAISSILRHRRHSSSRGSRSKRRQRRLFRCFLRETIFLGRASSRREQRPARSTPFRPGRPFDCGCPPWISTIPRWPAVTGRARLPRAEGPTSHPPTRCPPHRPPKPTGSNHPVRTERTPSPWRMDRFHPPGWRRI